MLLTSDHYALLHDKSAIADTLIKARGYQSLPQPEDLIDRGFSKAQARTAPVLGMPLWDVHGTRHGWQIRPDVPRQFKDGTLGKYETPLGDRNILDIHPSVQPLVGDPTTPLWITEGVRKGDALASQGQCTIALVGGVWGFRGTNEHKGKVILPDWEYVALNGRLVYVVYDSDIYLKRNVELALKALYSLLRERHARPALVRWPEEYRQAKIGVDDFLAQGHTSRRYWRWSHRRDPCPLCPPLSAIATRSPRRRSIPQRTSVPSAPVPIPRMRAGSCACIPPPCAMSGEGWILWTGQFWRPDPTTDNSLATGFVSKLGTVHCRGSRRALRRCSRASD